MHLMSLALPQEPAHGIAGWAADLVDTLGGPGADLAIAHAGPDRGARSYKTGVPVCASLEGTPSKASHRLLLRS